MATGVPREQLVPCPHCQAWNSPASRHCWACRRPLQPLAPDGGPSAGAAGTLPARGSPSARPPAAIEPTAPPRRGRLGVLGGVAALLVALVLIGGAVLYARSGPSAPAGATTTSTRTGTVAPSGRSAASPSAPSTAGPVLPAGASECAATFGDARVGRSARGNAATTCEFAETVRKAYLSTGADGASTTLTAHSPVTDEDYVMTCSGWAPVTCTGGNNAVVLLY